MEKENIQEQEVQETETETVPVDDATRAYNTLANLLL